MLQIETNSRAPIWASRQQTFTAARAQAAHILRVLILVLVGLLFTLVGLTILTGRIEIGGPLIGGVLLISFGAAQFGR